MQRGPDIHTLIGARLIQGIGGSMLNPVALSIISADLRRPGGTGQGAGLLGAVVGISMALGPIVGGFLIAAIGWRAVFWINLPICAVAVALTAIYVPESKSATMRDIDPIGQLLAVLSLFGLVYVLIEGPALGWTHPRIVVTAVIAAAAFGAFLRYESRRHDPFIDLRFFRSIPFASATVTAVCVFAACRVPARLTRRADRPDLPARSRSARCSSHHCRAGWSAGSEPARRCWCRGC